MSEPGKPFVVIDPASPGGDKSIMMEGSIEADGTLHVTSAGEVIEHEPSAADSGEALARKTTDEEVESWRLTPRPYNNWSDCEDALTRLAQDFYALTRPPSPPEGMETSDEERTTLRHWIERYVLPPGKELAILAVFNDFDRLAAELTTAKQHAQVIISSQETALDKALADLATAKRVADDAWRVHAENDRLRADVVSLRNERDGAVRDRDYSIGTTLSMNLSAKLKKVFEKERDGVLEAAELACLRGRDLYLKNGGEFDDLRAEVAEGLAITIRALKRPGPEKQT